MVPRCPPVAEYVASIEQPCTQLKQREAEELRGEAEDHSKEDTTPPNTTSQEKNIKY